MIDQELGDYKIVKSLGKGGFGSVWKAISSTGEDVALKVLNPSVLENEKVVRKFFHEAMILAKLDHVNICKLTEFFPDKGNYAIVMEYVEGTELKDLLRQHKFLPIGMAFNIAKQSLEAFQYAHENGILHRDIKPANIMITGGGVAKIMDFGIAKMSSTASHDTAASMLSVHYVPPERFDKSTEIDARSDIYSLALVFYEMFAGKRPFSATETSQIMFAHLNEIPEPPSKFVKDLPPRISQAILKALEKDPDDRFKDFKEFSNAMGEADPSWSAEDDATAIFDGDQTLIDQTIADSGTIALEPEEETKKKTWAVVAALVIILLVAAGVGGYLFLKPGVQETETGTTKVAEAGKKNSKGFIEIQHSGDGSTMVLIPEGEFTMGSDDYSAEKPIQKIYLDKYYIDKHLVTNALFQNFVEATNYVPDSEKDGAGMVRIGRRWKKVEGASWQSPDGLSTIDGKEDHPVSQVSYNDALSYCKWAKKDLPTEAQWEKAARGPDGNEYPWGNAEPNDTMANFDNIVGGTTSVSSYEKGKSFYGNLDMAGNVYQWCKDFYGTGERAAKNPTGPETGTEHVIKGGSFIEGMESLRSANRDRYEPNYSSFLFGFRCACEY